MLSTVMVIAVVLGTAFLFNELFKKLNLPPVVGQILGGLLLGIPLLQTFIFQTSQATEIIDHLAVLGILFLLMLVGLEIDIQTIRQSSKEAVFISSVLLLCRCFLVFCFLGCLVTA